jgi:serine/threonine-protein kinase
MTELEVGKEIGPYRILQKIAQGGMNPVYKGLHTGLEQEVAIKVLDRAALEDPAVRTRFINEAKIQASLSHPNVIKVLNYLEQDETVFLIMEYINGRPLTFSSKSRSPSRGSSDHVFLECSGSSCVHAC